MLIRSLLSTDKYPLGLLTSGYYSFCRLQLYLMDFARGQWRSNGQPKAKCDVCTIIFWVLDNIISSLIKDGLCLMRKALKAVAVALYRTPKCRYYCMSTTLTEALDDTKIPNPWTSGTNFALSKHHS